VIVTIYIDESGTHDSPVVILGGWVARMGQWASFDDKWRKLLKKYSVSYFHSKELRHSELEFKGWDKAKKSHFMNEAARLAMKSLAFGFTIPVKIDEYKSHYIGECRLQGVAIDSPYGLCFRFCLGMITGLAIDHFADKSIDVHFILESGHHNLGNAEKIFHEVKSSDWPDPSVQRIRSVLRTISRGDKKECPGLQLADINAYNIFQYETRNIVKNLITLPNLHTMSEAKKNQKVPIFHLPLNQEALRKFRGFLLDEIEEKRIRRETAFLKKASQQR
jgi:hypothetical protein